MDYNNHRFNGKIMTIIVDSNYFFALKSKKDKNHQRSLNLLKDLKEKYKKPIITNYLVISELLTLVNSRFKGNIYSLDNYYKLIWGEDNFFKIIQFLPEQYKESYEILKKFTTPNRLLSFVDASLIYLGNIVNARAILSYDNHFDGIISRLY